MVLHIERTLKSLWQNWYTFSVREHPELSAKLNCWSGGIIHKLQIYEGGLQSICVKQPNTWKRLFYVVFFFWPEFPPINIYRGDECIGSSLQLKSAKCYRLQVNGLDLTVRFHLTIKRNDISIWVGDRQVALMNTDGSGQYEIKFDSFSSDAPELLLLLCTIIDAYQYTHGCGGKPSSNIHYITFGRDKYKSALSWTPSDE